MSSTGVRQTPQTAPRRRLSWRRLVAGSFVFGGAGSTILAGAFGGATAATTIGCTTHQCDPSSYDYFGGFALDADTFVTSNIDDPWLSYNGQTTIRVWFPPQFANRTVIGVIAQVGTDSTPNGGPAFVDGDNWIYTDGQLAYYNFLASFPGPEQEVNEAGAVVPFDGTGTPVGGGFSVLNATCADYWARFTVSFVPLDAGAGVVEPTNLADASAGAGTD